ncbi:MAG TPA: glycosyltransferase [Vicinamibacterales bacterium]|jgi:dolichol-phosphate mannosyltransferase
MPTVASPQRICILLPVLNEAAHIGPLWTRIRDTLAPRDYVICFVDDGSTDGTVEQLLELSQQHPSQVHVIHRRKMMRGCQRGGALFTGLQWALSLPDVELIVEMDGDLSHRPEEMTQGLQMVASGACDIAIASKYLPGSEVVNRPLSRRAVSYLCNHAVRLLLTREISDYSNGFRFYSRRAGLAVASAQIRYGSPIYLSEVLAIWLHDGFRVSEFKSIYVGRAEGLSKLRPLDLVKATIAIFEIAWRYHTGRFSVLRLPEHGAFKP